MKKLLVESENGDKELLAQIDLVDFNILNLNLY